MVVFELDNLEVFFPYDYIYPEQYAYMKYLKKTLDNEGHCVLEMPTGTGKTVAIFSLITSYQYDKNDESKFIFCTRTVAEMEKSLIELKKVIQYRVSVLKRRLEKGGGSDHVGADLGNGDNERGNGEILGIGISARRCMCVNEKVLQKHEREKIDEECRKLTATFVREKKYINKKIDKYDYVNAERITDFILKNKHHIDVEDYFDIYNSRNTLEEYNELGLCGYFENFEKEFNYDLIKSGVYTIEDLKNLCKNYRNVHNEIVPICPYFFAKKVIEIAKVIILNYQYIIDPKVSKSLFLGKEKNSHVNYKKNDIIVFDEAHNIDSVCLEALTVNIDRNILNKASSNIKKLFKKIEKSRALNEEKLKEECQKILQQIKASKLEGAVEGSQKMGNVRVDWGPKRGEANNQSACEEKGKKGDDRSACEDKGKKNDDRSAFEEKGEKSDDHRSISVDPPRESDAKKRKLNEGQVYFDDDMNLVFTGSGDNIMEGLKGIIDHGGEETTTRDVMEEVTDREGDPAELLYSPLLMEDIVKNVVIPGNIRKSEHFLNLMRIVVVYLKKYINIYEVTSEGPLSFLYKCERDTKLDTSFFKYAFDRLKSLLNALQIVNIEDYSSLNIVCNFCTLLGNYFKGFIIICEPYPEATGIYDPVLQFACLDSSIAMKSVINKYKSIVLTSGTITPLELYPKLLNFRTVLTASFPMSFDRNCVCPLIVTKSSDLVPLSSQYSLRNDMNVIKNYGMLLVEMCKNIPDGIVAYFPSYIYMEQVISFWYESGIISDVLEYKLIFIETKDIVSTTIALHNFKKACDLGKGAVFLSICRGKIAEGIDFDKHYGKCVILYGIPYQYTLSRILKSRLDFLKETYNIQENEFLTFDAMRQASQCVGRIIRNKKDYGIMIFSDIRYSRKDKKNKLPPWIIKCMDISNVNLTVGTAVNISKKFLLNMSQEYKETGQTKFSQELLQNQRKCWAMVKSVLNMDDLI
ncbi:TFIIH basal transcription factor complex helicase XPD subunit, putative [Plasmodium ovale]|uniref:DNA 5'-3' helicase n=2 Tax=Plasmodium ovale TaxID=36330 RepID=A0A1A8W266_PLAOA|nr:TFIIH basal transcription factor complex helicase XPD subunit, putative (XPD) [Plasmodium ovale curtisi]SCQ16330.1 TFIIH basal transcription factor complex helicase XPD subunit, putative [Plasmodium ovale]